MSKPNDLCKDNKATVMLIKPGPLIEKYLPVCIWKCPGFVEKNAGPILFTLLCATPDVFPGGTLDFKWQGWSNGGKIQNPTKSLELNTIPKKIPCQISES